MGGTAAAGALAVIGLARLTPIVLLPLFYRFKPLDRATLRSRIESLSQRAGVPVLGVYEWSLGEKTRRANAALVGTGRSRRILLSDTLLAHYSDDEIEVILAHELGHHAHRDIRNGLVIETILDCGRVRRRGGWRCISCGGRLASRGRPTSPACRFWP